MWQPPKNTYCRIHCYRNTVLQEKDIQGSTAVPMTNVEEQLKKLALRLVTSCKKALLCISVIQNYLTTVPLASFCSSIGFYRAMRSCLLVSRTLTLSQIPRVTTRSCNESVSSLRLSELRRQLDIKYLVINIRCMSSSAVMACLSSFSLLSLTNSSCIY
jgi:hypothetical protein